MMLMTQISISFSRTLLVRDSLSENELHLQIFFNFFLALTNDKHGGGKKTEAKLGECMISFVVALSPLAEEMLSHTTSPSTNAHLPLHYEVIYTQ